ncbi:MAG TPA: oligosaccharide flippase family protein [Dyella sp.]|uniref:oligosaccharide flippase family protein n=1 Tax=Dyella sp. TaxID=1869338 RepID=UPI002F95798D
MSAVKGFGKNAISLYAIQGLQYLSAVIVLPVLARKLNAPEFGELAYWQALVGTLGLLIDYGFNYSAVRNVSRHADQPQLLGTIYRSTMAARAILLVPAILLLLAIPAWVGTSNDRTMQALGLLMLIGMTLSPAWYLTGLRQTTLLAIASAITALLTVVMTWVLVEGPQALHIAAAIQFAAPLVTSLVAYALVRRHAPVPPGRCSRTDIWSTLREGAPLFLTSASAGIYSTLNPFLLGLVAAPTQVAFFSLGERIARAARSLFSPLMAALFPYAVSHRKQDRPSNPWLARTTGVTLLAAGVVSLGLIVTLPWIALPLFGHGYLAGVGVAQILALNVAVVTAGNIKGVQGLIAQGRDKPVVYVTMLAAPLHIVAFLWAGSVFGAVGAAIAYVAIECLVTLSFYVIASRTATHA